MAMHPGPSRCGHDEFAGKASEQRPSSKGTPYILRALFDYYDTRNVRDNNLDLLRLTFSFAVVYFHFFVLTNASVRSIPYSVDTAVQGFFCISGYLIFASYDKSSDISTYLLKRARRIYPAYCFVVVGAALGFYFVSGLHFTDYFGADWLKYVSANLLFLNFLAPTLPGVFSGNPMPAVNGSLWTIKVEVAFYLSVPILVALSRRVGPLRAMITLYLASYLYFVGFKLLAKETGHGFYEELAKQLPGQMRYFVVGGLCYFYRNRLQRYLGLLGIVAILLMVFSDCENSWLLKPVILGAAVFGIAFGPPLVNVSRWGDISYGAYLLHFPLIQLAVALQLFGIGSTAALCSTLFAVTICAYVCWHMVEKPFLQKESHYILAEEGS